MNASKTMNKVAKRNGRQSGRSMKKCYRGCRQVLGSIRWDNVTR